MRHTNYSLTAAVMMLAALAVSCSVQENETVEAPVSAEKTVLRLNLTATRTSLGESEENARKVYWSDGDKVVLNGTPSAALADVEEGATSAEFSFEGTLTAPYNILYPADIYTTAGSVTLPVTQTWKQGTFDDGMFPMAAYSADGSSPSLEYLCAVVKISILLAASDPDTDNIRLVTFAGGANEQVSGVFNLNYQTAALTATSSAADDKKVQVSLNQALSASTPLDIFLVVPARNYASGFSITVQDSQGHIMTKTLSASTTLEAGKLYNTPAFRFIPSGLATGIEISNAQELIDFATAYNNKDISNETVPGGHLVATVTQNIVFNASTSAAFNATGGIGLKTNINGNEDYYFDGTFNGNGKTISGLSATVPLFVATGANGTVLDLTLANSCTFTFTHPNTTEADLGSVVGYHKGLLQNVTVNADVTLAAVSGLTNETCLGGLVGREREGTIDNCSYSGAITIPSGFGSADKKIQIGGLVGRISNASGKVQDSSFSGTLENEGQMVASSETTDFKNNPQLMIGGIVGLNSGTVSSCTTANHAVGVTVTLTDTGGDHDYTGTIVTHSTNAYHYAIAGIAGRNDGTVSNCSNNAAVLNIFSAGRGTSGNMNGRYLEVGGIAGFNSADATVSDCVNNGAIVDRANPKLHYVGGIAGQNMGTVSSCDNGSTGTVGIGTSHLTPYGGRMLYAGGIIGFNSGSATLKNVHNSANMTLSRIEGTTGIISCLGGIIGKNDAAVDGSVDGSITNSGNVSQSSGIGHCATPTEDNDYGLFVGGVAAYSTAAVKNVSNGGKVTYTCTATGIGAQYVHLGGVVGKVKGSSAVDIEHCSNTAAVSFVATAGIAGENGAGTKYYYNYLGGIAGFAENAVIKGDASAKCTNSGVIKGGDGSGNNNLAVPSFHVGGIVGYIKGDSSVQYCALTGSGQAYNDHWSNRGNQSYDCPMDGGIVGQVVGTSDTPISISHCEIAGTAKVIGRRGAVGGIAGAVQYGTVSNCSVPINLTGNSSYFLGGIAALAQNSTISNCTYSGTSIQGSQIQLGGGIVGKLDAGTNVTGCSSYATTINKNGTAITAYGGIAGSSIAGSSIGSCHYKSSIQICGDTNFTNNGGNVADL